MRKLSEQSLSNETSINRKESTMKTKVWEVKMGSPKFPRAVVSVMNVRATTLSKAVSKANKIEREECAQVSEDEGVKVTPDKAISVLFLCELDDVFV